MQLIISIQESLLSKGDWLNMLFTFQCIFYLNEQFWFHHLVQQ